VVGNHPKIEGKMTSQELLQRYLLDAIGSVVPPRSGAYVAGPLATGRHYYELVAAGEDVAASRVRDENEEKMKAFVGSLRGRLSCPVIDPGLIKLDGWTSREVGDFYIKVIELFAKEVWFMDGWEYSRGATKEFQFAVANGVICMDSRGVIITSEEGCRMISDVVLHLKQLGIEPGRFVDRIAALRRA
jgi:hypothetical protein